MNVYEKIAAVMADVQYLKKDIPVELRSGGYKALSEEKVTSIVREKLIQYGLVILPVKQEHKKEGNLTTVDVTYRIINIDKPDEQVEVVSSGTGVDTQDKGVGKAMTYAYKYMLLRTFAIPTGEDTDRVSNDEIEKEVAEAEATECEELKEKIKSYYAKQGKNIDENSNAWKYMSLQAAKYQWNKIQNPAV